MKKFSLIVFLVFLVVMLSFSQAPVKYSNLFYFDHSVKTPSYCKEYFKYDSLTNKSNLTLQRYVYLADSHAGKLTDYRFSLDYFASSKDTVLGLEFVSDAIKELVHQKYNSDERYQQNITDHHNLFYKDILNYYDNREERPKGEELERYKDSLLFNIYVCEPVSSDSVCLKRVGLYNQEVLEFLFMQKL